MAAVAPIDGAARRRREFDAFGPWIHTIRDASELPVAFDGHVDLPDDRFIAFKIPKPLERRTTGPDEDLYRHVVVLGRDALSFYTLDDPRAGAAAPPAITRRDAAYVDVVAVSSLHDLLRGVWTIYLREGAIEIPFRTVSEEIIAAAAGHIRARASAAGRTPSASGEADVAVGAMDHIYGVLIRQERAMHEARVWGYQPDELLTRTNPRVHERILNLVWRTRRRSILFLETPSGLVIYHGDPQVARFGRGHYAYRRTEIYGVRADDGTVDRDGRFADSSTIAYRAGEHTFSYAVSDALRRG